MTAALAHFLPDFDLGRKRAAVRIGEPGGSAARGGDIAPLEIEEICMNARMEGRRAAETELSARHEAEIAAIESAHREEIAALTQRLSSLAAEAIPAAVSARAEAIAGEIAADVAAVLRPITTAKVVDEMVAAIAAEIRAACRIDAAATISVSGPKELLDSLDEKLAAFTAEITRLENDDCDLVLTIDKTVWSTRLASWAAALEGEIG